MDDEGKVPKLLAFLFGEGEAEQKHAALAQRGASTRLRGWCGAFEAWLEDRRQNYRPGAYKQAKQAWGRLLHQQGKMPWELRQEDFEQHAAWMETKGYARTTIANALGVMASFYRWCDERRIDPACGAGFNPAAGARRPKIQRYAGAKLLNRGEVEKLLGFMRLDESALGRRDYTFCLARLRLGAPLRNLQQLRWGQIEQEGETTWVRWRAEGGRVELPGEVWEAMRAWLRTSRRLEGMGEQDYIFTPLVDPLREQDQERPGAWAAGRYLSSSQILASLKLYGRRAGIEEEKLTLMALRRTAIRLRLEAGGSLGDSTNMQEMQEFLDSREEAKFTKSRLRRLPQLPQQTDLPTEAGGEGEREEQPAPPDHTGKPFQPGEGRRHGLYAHSQPPEALRAVLKEDIKGVEEQIAGLRWLERGLLEMQTKSKNSKEMALLAETYTLTAERLAKMIEAEKRLGKDGEEDTFVKDCLAMLDGISEEMGEGPISEGVRAEALGNQAELAINARRLEEEIAGTRLVLRDTLKMAMEAEQKGETADFIRLTNIYSIGCNRLMKLLRMGETEQGRLAAYLRELLERSLEEVQKEMPRL